jgi:hypothetical protein
LGESGAGRPGQTVSGIYRTPYLIIITKNGNVIPVDFLGVSG